MSGITLQIDPEIRAEFIDESLESLNKVTQDLVFLETSSTASQQIESIFRSVHSIKGSAPYFGLMNLAKLSHEIENVLDCIRNESLAIQNDLISTLLDGFDRLKNILERALNNESELTDQNSFDTYLAKLKNILAQDNNIEAVLWEQVISHPTVLDTPELHQKLIKLASLSDSNYNESTSTSTDQAYEQAPSELEELKTLFQSPSEELKIEVVSELMNRIATYNKNQEAQRIIDAALEEVILLSKTIGIDDGVTRDSFLSQLDTIASKAQWSSAATPLEENSSVSAPKDTPPKAEASYSKTIRVTEKSIEYFLEQIGELITLREMYTHLQLRINNLTADKDNSTEFRQLNGMFLDLSDKLLYSIMEIRKVPANTFLNKIHRIVRDIAQAEQKDIAVNIVGDDLLIDKSILELLEMPLVHMVRNAADHGIELPEVRQNNGKSPQGILDVSLVELEETLVLTIKDDGQGIHLKKLQEKAVEQKFIAKGETLTEKQLIDLLFQPGLSTAQEVTDISGRGVGMDVVRQNIKQAGGVVSVETNEGVGSKFSIEIPRNMGTQVIKGFVVVVGSERFVIPVPYVLKTFQLTKSMYTNVAGKGECIRYEDSVIPVLPLSTVLKNTVFDHAAHDVEERIVVVLEYDSFRFALSIDAVDSIMQLVLKDIDDTINFEQIFSGAALLGDGSVSLVIDVEKVAESFQKGHSKL